MGFIEIPGFTGKLYVPDEEGMPARKHNCRDCFHCQQCSDDRCVLCLKRAVMIDTRKDNSKDDA